MNLLALFTGVVYAVSSIIAPVPQNIDYKLPNNILGAVNTRPASGFGNLTVPTPTQYITPTPTPIPTRKAKKSNIKIALLGDSMIDTLGPDMPFIVSNLKTIYPDTQFEIINLGVGGTNIEYGLERVKKGYKYFDKTYPPLVDLEPDLVIIESFGYNPFTFSEGALERHWLFISEIIDLIKNNLPNTKIMIASTIAPNNRIFGDGASGLNFSPQDKKSRTAVIKSYLLNALKFARGENIPYADAYNPSLDRQGNGKTEYINPGDSIHYSVKGMEFFSKILTDAIIKYKLVE